MEYSIYLNQPRIIDWQLTYAEAILCSYYANEHNWVRTRIVDADGDYLCIAIPKLIEELPIIGKTKFPFSKALNKLVKKGFFEKIVDKDSSRTVFYRIYPPAKLWWKYAEVNLASSLTNKTLFVIGTKKELEALSNDNSVIKCKQVLSNDNEVLSNDNEVLSNDNEVLSNDNLSYKQSYKQSINNHINIGKDEDDSLRNSTKENLAKKEFDRIIEMYPYTINNSPKILTLAFGSYLNLSQIQKADLFKAVKNYSKTQQVKDHIAKGTTNFIQNLNNFITKSFTEFIHGLPEKFTYAEEFEPKKNPNGGETFSDVVTFNGLDKDAISLKPYIKKFEQVKAILENDENFDVKNCDDYDDSKMKEIFDAKEYEIFSKRMGWLQFAYKYTTVQLADTMNDYLGEV